MRGLLNMEEFSKKKKERQLDGISLKKMAVFSELGRLSKEEQHRALDRFMAVMRQMTKQGK